MTAVAPGSLNEQWHTKSEEMAPPTTPHPLSSLNVEEIKIARELTIKAHPNAVIDFRQISMSEPPKAEVLKFLELEHSGQVDSSTARPARLAQVNYDVVEAKKAPQYHECIVDVRSKTIVAHETVPLPFQPGLTL